MQIPSALISIALYEPEIPGNAGSVARLCAATGSPLHLIGRLGFSLQHPKAKRAVMDYWADVEMHRHLNYDEFAAGTAARRVWAFSTRAERLHWDADFSAGDVLLFGPESRGLPESLLVSSGVQALRLPMLSTARSLNLSTSVSAALYEALRQLRWAPA
ncbi:tRNA (cytidine(34)-2'-O)-methyltransferase [soil metagenome]